MIDQSHNLKGKIEAMIQTVDDRAGAVRQGGAGRSRARWSRRSALPISCAPKSCLQDAFATDVRPAIAEWRSRQWAARAIRSRPFASSGYLERITGERAARHAASATSYA